MLGPPILGRWGHRAGLGFMLSNALPLGSPALVLLLCIAVAGCGDGGDGGGGSAGSGSAQHAVLGQDLTVSLSPGKARYFDYGAVAQGAFFAQITGLPRGSSLFIRMHDGLHKDVHCTLGEGMPGPCNIELGADAIALEVTFENAGDKAIEFHALVNRR